MNTLIYKAILGQSIVCPNCCGSNIVPDYVASWYATPRIGDTPRASMECFVCGEREFVGEWNTESGHAVGDVY
jgi:hypothetical protein